MLNTLALVIFRILAFMLAIFTVLATGLFSICRYILGLYLSYKYKQRIQFANGSDTYFSIDCENCRFIVGGCQIFKGRADIDKIRQRFDERWLQPRVNGAWKYGKFRKQLKREFGYYFWIEQEKFQIENHVLLHEGPVPRSKDELQRFCVETLSNLPLNKGILWQFVFVNLSNNLKSDRPDPHFILFLRSYHGLFDGISINRMYRLLFDDVEQPDLIPKKTSTGFGLVDIIKFWGNGIIFGPYEFLYHIFKRIERHSLLGPKFTGMKLIAFSDPIPLEKIKRIKDKAKTTVNDVMIASVIGGFRAFFLWKNEKVPREMNFLIPISFHNFQNEAKIENNMSSGSLLVPINEPNCIQRLLKTKMAMDKLKVSPLVSFSYLVLFCCNRIPLFIMTLVSSMILSTAIVSCFPMPRPTTFLGNESMAQNLCFTIPNGISGCGMAVCVPSEGETLVFVINADLGFIKSQENLDKLVGFMTNELDALDKEYMR